MCERYKRLMFEITKSEKEEGENIRTWNEMLQDFEKNGRTAEGKDGVRKEKRMKK